MSNTSQITGVSAVNQGGVVVIFVEASMPDFERFHIVGNEIRLLSLNDDYALSRVYGNATIDTVSRSGVLVVQKLNAKGDDAGNYVIEVAHGL